MTPFEFLLCLCLVLISAFLSSAEIALFSLSRFQLRTLRERIKPAYRKIKRLLSDPGGLLITILFTNELINISISTIVTHGVSRKWHTENVIWPLSLLPNWTLHTALGILFTTPVVLFLCEITPKVIAARANQVIAPLSVGGLTWFYTALKPVRWFLTYFLQKLKNLLPQDQASPVIKESEPLLREKEFLLLLEEGHKEGDIEQSELDLIKNVFELDNTTVEDVYTPLHQVRSISARTSVKAAITEMRERKYSRIPVTAHNEGRKITGILFTKDLLFTRIDPAQDPSALSQPIEALVRKPMVVPPSMRLNVLFRKMKQNQTHMAVVEKNPGEAMGIVTMHDVLDALFEDLFVEEEVHREISR